MPTRVQLHRALSKLGICSRREAINLILQGQVTVQGQVITQPLTWVELGSDSIEVSDHFKATKPGEISLIYLAMHKPRGVVTTRQDERNRKTVFHILPAKWKTSWLFPVGRLDRDSEGLLLFTNDGRFADRILDPDQHIEKAYRVQLNHLPSDAGLDKLRLGLRLGAMQLKPVEVHREKGLWFQVSLQEGKNRQIRRMFHALNCKVKRLIRIAIGPVVLGPLPVGEVRELTQVEKKKLNLQP